MVTPGAWQPDEDLCPSSCDHANPARTNARHGRDCTDTAQCPGVCAGTFHALTKYASIRRCLTPDRLRNHLSLPKPRADHAGSARASTSMPPASMTSIVRERQMWPDLKRLLVCRNRGLTKKTMALSAVCQHASPHGCAIISLVGVPLETSGLTPTRDAIPPRGPRSSGCPQHSRHKTSTICWKQSDRARDY